MVAEIAGRQHGVIYAVGHRKISQEGRWIAAVFAFGPQAVLSHDSAAALWGLARSPTSAVVHVTVPTSNGRTKRRGIRLHYSSSLTSSDTTRRKNIPVTTRERTLADMGWDSEPTRSHLERLFLKLIRTAGLPRPEVNAKVGPYTVDFLWRAQRLVVETDGYEFHSSRASFESDRRRDRELQRRGFVVLRFTYRDVTERQRATVDALQVQLLRTTPRLRPGRSR